METRNKYHFYKKELSKLLKSFDSISFYQDDEILTRILNLLTEDIRTDKIQGIISTSEIVIYGGNISDEVAHKVYQKIIDWFEEKK